MNPKVIIVNGPATSGKSTFVSLCREINPDVREVSTVDKVKEIALAFGCDGIKDEKGRKLLSDLKDAIDRYDNLSLKNVAKVIDSNPDLIYMVNAREPEDIQYFVDRYNALTVLITNNRVKQITSNHADKRVFEYHYDVTIENNGTLEELKEKARELLRSL